MYHIYFLYYWTLVYLAWNSWTRAPKYRTPILNFWLDTFSIIISFAKCYNICKQK